MSIRPGHRRLVGSLTAVGFAAQLWGGLAPSALALGSLLAALVLTAPAALRRLWMPRFWLITIACAFGCGLLLGPRDIELLGLPLSRTGLVSGAQMVVRGAYVFAALSWLSRAVSGRGLERLASRLGGRELATSAGHALRLLPSMQSQLRRAGDEIKVEGPRRSRPALALASAVQLVAACARIAESLALKRSAGAGPLRIAVVGPPGSGKSATLAELVLRLEGRVELGGVLQPKRLEGATVEGYDLADAASGERRPFAIRRPRGAPGSIGFAFDAALWPWARERVLEARTQAAIVVVDELGRLEAEGDGHLPALLEPVAEERASIWLLGVRADRRDRVEERLGGFARTIRPTDDPVRLDRLADELVVLSG